MTQFKYRGLLFGPPSWPPSSKLFDLETGEHWVCMGLFVHIASGPAVLRLTTSYWPGLRQTARVRSESAKLNAREHETECSVVAVGVKMQLIVGLLLTLFVLPHYDITLCKYRLNSQD